MSKYDGKVTVGTALDNKGLEKGINNISGSLGGLKSVVGKLGGVIAAAFSVKAMVDFSKAAIELGSNLEEVQNVVNVSFGAMAGAAEEFASTAITKFGMSELAAKQTASTYMAMAKGMGVAEGAASDMSITLAGLSGDVASFYNLDQEDAAKKLQGVFTGESEALKSLGVVMTQTNLKQFALERGMNANIEAMSQAELVALRYAFVTDALSLAAGDFERTQDSWANQTRILSMQWQQFMGIIGQTLTTVLTPAIKLLNSLVTVLINVAQKIQTVVANLFGKAVTQTDAVAKSAAAGAAAQEDLADGVTKAGKAAKKSLAGFDQLNILQSPDSGKDSAGASAGAGSIPDISGGTVTVSSEVQDDITPKIQALIEKIKGFAEEISIALQPSTTAWTTAWEDIKTSAVSAFDRVKISATGLWNEHLKPFSDWMLTSFAPDIVNSFSTAFAPIYGGVYSTYFSVLANNFESDAGRIGDAITNIIQPALELFRDVWDGLMGGIQSGWNEYGEPIMTGIEDAFINLQKIIDTWYYSYIEPIVTNLIEECKELWDKHLKPLWDNVTAFVGSVMNCILALWNNVLAPVVNWIMEKVYPKLVRIFNVISAVVSTVIGVIVDKVKIAIRWFRGIMDFLTNVFEGDWEGAWNSIKSTFTDIWGMIKDTIKNTANGVIKVINKLIAAIYGGISDLVNGFGGIVKSVGKIVGKEDWGFSIPEKPPAIPYLAKGAVIPPNREFMAILGDQKHGTNIEAPLDTIKQALAEVLAMQQGGGGDTIVRFTGDLAQLGRVLKPVIEKEERRTGTSLAKGAVL